LTTRLLGCGTLGVLKLNNCMRILIDMRRWTVKPRSVVLLLALLFVILLVLVLPQVDLLDTAFQLNTAPVAIHRQATAAPVAQIVHSLVLLASLAYVTTRHERQYELLPETNRNIPVLDHSLRC